MSTRQRYLEVTFRNGRPIAAYLYLPREAGDRSARTQRFDHGLLVDFAEDGRAIGVEITAPSKVSRKVLDELLKTIQAEPTNPGELAPLLAA